MVIVTSGKIVIGFDVFSTGDAIDGLTAAEEKKLIAMGLVMGACVLGASSSAVTLGGVPLFGGLGLIVGVALAIYVFVKTRPYLK